MIPVEGHKGLYRDENSNAIVNCNDSDYDDYIKLKSKIISEKDEINGLKNQISELQELLKKVLDVKT